MRTAPVRLEVAVDDVAVDAYTVPTDAPEADGTLSWTATTIVVVHADGGGEQGLGYSYTDALRGPAHRVDAGPHHPRN